MFTSYENIAEKVVCHALTESELEINNRDTSNADSSFNPCLSVHPSACPCDHMIFIGTLFTFYELTNIVQLFGNGKKHIF